MRIGRLANRDVHDCRSGEDTGVSSRFLACGSACCHTVDGARVVGLGVWRPSAYETRVSFADVFVFVTGVLHGIAWAELVGSGNCNGLA